MPWIITLPVSIDILYNFAKERTPSNILRPAAAPKAASLKDIPFGVFSDSAFVDFLPSCYDDHSVFQASNSITGRCIGRRIPLLGTFGFLEDHRSVAVV